MAKGEVDLIVKKKAPAGGGRSRARGEARLLTSADARAPAGQVVQETDGQVQLPLVWMVTPKVLPLPFGLATRVCVFG
ncbi:hypothetical protein Asi03nite_54040 [Actinoplanes siamensis]|uniref:Uncharacterized protein n=1 Tax=Actinoplanes siamensis TaxID=1223317 RepID=A0A919TM22_9ACTN|nr:hypothetical protein Asi03nite_54040 [Actinoplanes siamensis]